jgi:tyrosinase
MAFVRRDIWTLDPGDPIVTWYREGVRVMKERHADQPLSWEYQAAIHGIPSGSGQRPLYNQCQHAQWFFLPWHRMYVLRFEAIVRAAVEAAGGPSDWALPYWNYSLGGKDATLPIPFRDPEVNGKANSLYVQQRRPGLNEGQYTLHEKATSPRAALARPHFVGSAEFGGGENVPSHQRAGKTGRIEETPHNDVHVEIGGPYPGWMSYPETAAKDPIFWLHHTNIDRLWQVWNEAAGHADPTTGNWTEQEFELFDIHGHKASMKCADVTSIAKLGYEYDHKGPTAEVAAIAAVPPPPPPPAEGGAVIDKPHMVGATEKPITLVGAPVEVEIPIDAAEAGELAPGQHVYLNSEEITGDRNPAEVYAVYVALPPDPSPADEERHHVGNLSFFGIERNEDPAGDENPHGFRLAVDITPIAHELAAAGRWAGHSLAVSIDPLNAADAAHPETPITIGRISVFYDA